MRKNCPKTRIRPSKNFKKWKFCFFKDDPKLDKNHLQDLQKLRKSIFNIVRKNLDENCILKKNVFKIAKKSWKCRGFEILIVSLWPEVIWNRPKIGHMAGSIPVGCLINVKKSTFHAFHLSKIWKFWNWLFRVLAENFAQHLSTMTFSPLFKNTE